MGEPKNLEIPSAYPHVEPHDVKDEHLIVMSTFSQILGDGAAASLPRWEQRKRHIRLIMMKVKPVHLPHGSDFELVEHQYKIPQLTQIQALIPPRRSPIPPQKMLLLVLKKRRMPTTTCLHRSIFNESSRCLWLTSQNTRNYRAIHGGPTRAGWMLVLRRCTRH